MTEEQLWESLAEAVVQMDDEKVRQLAEEVLAQGFSARAAILNGLTEGMRRVGEKFSQQIYFVPEVLVCADAMYAGFDILREHVPKEDQQNAATVVIGVVKGDMHDIGKNIVALMLQSSGFQVVDLGANVAIERFAEAVKQQQPQIVALSTLMSTTLIRMQETVDQLRRQFGAACPRIMIGGAPVTPAFARQIGADFYGKDAHEAVMGAKSLLGRQ